MRGPIGAGMLGLMLLAGGRAGAAPVVVDIDPTQSSVRFRLCIGSDCDDDTSRVDGTVEVECDDYRSPGAIALDDFELRLVDDLDLRIDVFLGRLDVHGRSVVARYARPGTVHGPVPVAGDAFSWRHVPTDLEGSLNYDATGSICVLLAAAGYPCSDRVNLADRGTQDGDPMNGTVAVAGDQLTLVLDPNMSVPLDPDQPDLGRVTLSGTVIGYATIPCPLAPGPVVELRAARHGADVSFSWRDEPASSLGYRLYGVGAKSELPATGSNPTARRECETGALLDTSCSAPGAIADPEPLRLYQVVGVCGDGSEGAS